MPEDLDIRLLRHFIAVAEELHFSRAAHRLFIAQQALSRDVKKLEDRVGKPLLDRNTRRVALTPAGTALLARARELVALHDTTVRELREETETLTVDVVGPALTPAVVLARARRLAPELEFFGRFHTGDESALLHAGGLDVTFGWARDLPDGIRHRLVRYEPLAALVPERHPLAALDAVPVTALRGTVPCCQTGDHVTPGWTDLVTRLFTAFGIESAAKHPHLRGADELAEHVRLRDFPVLVLASQAPVPGAVLLPVVDPVPVFPWAMIYREYRGHPGLAALHAAVEELAGEKDWRLLPADAWVPDP
ncbi:LysR family transcriptional regulator [Amycolatopsis sp. CA-230715]|uniref:LysR family transcriptional regulator n=1 Tax=Amycolatopsis sp. CA-230715 TaxID=2745196 RepID=UPI001C0192F6|nr:LysR family transcriptional regulator [Amycolatopsis sp. CA-230715]QWF83210.1 HTH-type transcriptional regulator ArgP [Amycolatopsis sp. CA-230715]